MLPSLRQLEYLVSLADTGQFVQSARECAVSQPALSKQVREVEDMLGVQLFERARPRVLPTPAGAEVVARARKLLADAQDLVGAAHAWSNARRGTLRLGVIPTIAPYGLPGLLAKLRVAYPEASYAIHELQTEVLVQRLREGSIDLGLLAQPFDDHALTGPNLVVEPFVLVAPTGHSLARSGPMRAHELEGASLILMQDGHCLRDQAIEICALAGPPPPTAIAAGSVSTLVRMVESGLGASLLPASALASEVHEGQGLVLRGFGKQPPGRTLTLKWRTSSPQGEWFGEICEVLCEHYVGLNAMMPKVAGAQPRIRVVS